MGRKKPIIKLTGVQPDIYGRRVSFSVKGKRVHFDIPKGVGLIIDAPIMKKKPFNDWYNSLFKKLRGDPNIDQDEARKLMDKRIIIDDMEDDCVAVPMITQYEKCKKAKHKLELQKPKLAHIDGSDIYCLDCKRIIGFITETKSGRVKSG